MGIFGFGKSWKEKRNEAALKTGICRQCESNELPLENDGICNPCGKLSNLNNPYLTDNKFTRAAGVIFHYEGEEFRLLRDKLLQKYEIYKTKIERVAEMKRNKVKEWILK